MTLPVPKECPCGGAPTALRRKGEEAAYADCCGRFIAQGQLPPDALHLMRSRYTAFVLEDKAYLQHTWHRDHRPEALDFDEGAKWLGLEIKDFVETGVQNGQASAEVEFVARVRVAGKAQRLHERSRFVCEQGQWLYVEAV